MTEWLTDDEQQTWRGLVYLTAQLSAKFNRQLQEEHGISLADYEVLARLHDAPEEGLRSRDLQATLVWEQSRLSHQLTRMQGRGLVRRHDCATDRRGATFTLTDTGHRGATTAVRPPHARRRDHAGHSRHPDHQQPVQHQPQLLRLNSARRDDLTPGPIRTSVEIRCRTSVETREGVGQTATA
jgi:DNA-binding MarR family transcriptional regulator